MTILTEGKSINHLIVQSINFIKGLIDIIEKRVIESSNQINIGAKTYGYKLNTFRLWEKDDGIQIGKYCSIADNVVIFGGGEHFLSRVTTYPLKQISKELKTPDRFSKGKTIIENDVWIGEGVCILSGIRICNGAVIGARAVVTKDIPPYAVVAGNPMKIIRFRFNQTQINRLLAIKWWDVPEKELNKKAKLFLDVDEFIRHFS
ncbi:CatB-related O-acetyltransferase [Patescibacteria group bacterium]|nr:CatB-related O-acetyltransferase [Patescibacteria group bacterium]